MSENQHHPPLNPDFQYIELDYSRNDKYAQVELPEETEPPRISQIEIYPYPHLTKLWIKIQLTYFKTYPNIELYLYDPDDQLLGDMLFVEHRNFYVDVTMHLRAEPRPGESYRLEVFLIRDNTILDHRSEKFNLVFVDPETGQPVSGEERTS